MLFDHLYAQASIREHLSESQCRALTDPTQYLGSTGEMIDRALAVSLAFDR
jgi:adenylosuccinate lyase